MRVWVDGIMYSAYVEDLQRCLGTVIEPMITHPGKWDARTNLKLNASGTAALSLGLFSSLDDAKAAVEAATQETQQ